MKPSLLYLHQVSLCTSICVAVFTIHTPVYVLVSLITEVHINSP